MSSPERGVILSPEAEDDFATILAHSRQTWGAAQADLYEATIDGALASIGRLPELGRSREDAFPGARSHRVRQHVIFYRVEEMAIRVVRILHVRMDSERAFAGWPRKDTGDGST
jgi:toxin ParE1/3/4